MPQLLRKGFRVGAFAGVLLIRAILHGRYHSFCFVEHAGTVSDIHAADR